MRSIIISYLLLSVLAMAHAVSATTTAASVARRWKPSYGIHGCINDDLVSTVSEVALQGRNVPRSTRLFGVSHKAKPSTAPTTATTRLGKGHYERQFEQTTAPERIVDV